MQVRRYVPMAGLDRIRAADLEHIQVEAREVTAIFCDVRGFTSFSEKLQPEDLMRVINRYLSLASDAVNLYEGIVDKYMGDAVTGLYNTQLNPQEDHAIRCVRAALSLVSDLYAQHEVLPEDQRLFYGIGIHNRHFTYTRAGNHFCTNATNATKSNHEYVFRHQGLYGFIS
jgi:adenylate cyclase